MNSSIIAARNFIAAKNYIKACEILLVEYVQNPPRVTEDNVFPLFSRLIPRMLSLNQKAEVAHLLWGYELFDPRPRSVKLIWGALEIHCKNLIIGAGSLGKSWTVAAWHLLDWLEDPLQTAVKVVSLTAEHAEKNVFALIKRLHADSSLPLPGHAESTSIMASDDESQGIHLVAIPKGDDGKGSLQGFHPKPRVVAHPKFGTLSRVRALLDEGEEIPGGAWEGIDNMLNPMAEGMDHIKITSSANPRDMNSKFGLRCEPKESWEGIDIEDSHQWISKLDWHITRLDGYLCENVQERKIVYPGLLTYEGYRNFLLKGTDHPEYYTMARGWFPPRGTQATAIPAEFVDRAMGTAHFIGPVTYAAAVDLAMEGQDDVSMTVGKFGIADSRTCLGKEVRFAAPKWVLQVESQFTIPKHDPEKKMTQTMWIAHKIQEHCEVRFKIKPEFLIVDRTGVGSGTHDVLMQKMGREVMGVNYGNGATDRKILEDDSQVAEDVYDGIVTELFFATRRFMEVDSLIISPSVSMDPLRKELSERLYRDGSKKRLRIESKREYKARGNPSPDRADSLTLLVHLVRMRRVFRTSMLAAIVAPQRSQGQPSLVDKLGTISFD